MVTLESVELITLVILLAPLGGAVITGVLGPVVLRRRSHWPVILGLSTAFVASLILLLRIGGEEATDGGITYVSQLVPLYSWIPGGGGTSFQVEMLVDPLSTLMVVVVTGIALLVSIYSRDYMRSHGQPERGYERFFAYIGLFVFAMTVLVLGGNFLLLYLGWEAVGLCSYLLIGFHYQRPTAAAAAKKAFLVNRVGDFGFGLGIVLIYVTFGALDYGTVFDLVQRGVTGTGAELPQSRLTVMALLLFCGACGKSAQLPLHVWLPDAMEGPSPVSALIHAATMVTAGVFMIARCGTIFASSATAMTVVAVVGVLTAFFAATIALVQTDMKRILAYSTISQLGYMFLGMGVYAADAAMFHLYTHAFFKALLFLGAGSVMHGLQGVIDLRHFGGLRRVMPWTFATFLMGALALAGIPGFSGFFSKDEILHHAFEVHWFYGFLGLLTAGLTAFYTFRMVAWAFLGRTRIPEGVHAHESGAWMLIPLVVLSLGAVAAGYVGTDAWGRGFHRFLSPVFEHSFSVHTPFHAAEPGPGLHDSLNFAGDGATLDSVSWLAAHWLMVTSGAVSILGLVVACVVYVRMPWIPGLIRAAFPGAYDVLWNKYYVDQFYGGFIVEPVRRLGRFCVALDDLVIDGLVWFCTALPRATGYLLRGFQGGTMQGYGLGMVGGIALLMLFVIWF